MMPIFYTKRATVKAIPERHLKDILSTINLTSATASFLSGSFHPPHETNISLPISPPPWRAASRLTPVCPSRADFAAKAREDGRGAAGRGQKRGRLVKTLFEVVEESDLEKRWTPMFKRWKARV